MKIKALALTALTALMLTACGNADSSATHVPADVSTTTTTTTTTTSVTTTDPTTTTTASSSATDSESSSVTTAPAATVTTTPTTTPAEASSSEVTTTTTETTEPKVTTTTKKPVTTTKATTTTAKKTTTTKKATTTKATTTAKKTTTTTTTTAKKADEPPKDAVQMYCNLNIQAKPTNMSKDIFEVEKNTLVYVAELGDKYSKVYYKGEYGYVLTNGLSYLPVERADEEICMLINELRVSLGLNELRIDEELCEMATVRSAEENLPTTSPHVRPDGSSFSTILDEYGWSWGFATENQCSGTDSARLAVEDWRTSEGHLRNMTFEGLTAMGVGRADDGFWVAIFVTEKN